MHVCYVVASLRSFVCMHVCMSVWMYVKICMHVCMYYVNLCMYARLYMWALRARLYEQMRDVSKNGDCSNSNNWLWKDTFKFTLMIIFNVFWIHKASSLQLPGITSSIVATEFRAAVRSYLWIQKTLKIIIKVNLYPFTINYYYFFLSCELSPSWVLQAS